MRPGEKFLQSEIQQKKIQLGGTSIVGNNLVSCEESCHQFGSDGCGVTEVHQREVAEEEVHGGVETRVQQDQRDHPQVPNQGEEADEREH